MSGDADGWIELAREPVFDDPHLRVLRERLATPSRPHGVSWIVARRKRAAVVAPRTAAGDFILIQQERVPVRRALWEFPAGQVDGAGSNLADAAAETARRELAEEAGLDIGGELIPCGGFYSSPGFTDEYAYLFLATDVIAREGGHAPDEHEAILGRRAFSPAALAAMIASGEICDANTLALVARMCAAGHLILADAP